MVQKKDVDDKNDMMLEFDSFIQRHSLKVTDDVLPPYQIDFILTLS